MKEKDKERTLSSFHCYLIENLRQCITQQRVERGDRKVEITERVGKASLRKSVIVPG